MNKVILIGRTTKDLDLMKTSTGTSYCRFSLAVNREFNREETDFINCVAFGKSAEIISLYVQKGNRIAIDGRMQTDSYENQQGDKVYTTDVIVNRVEFLESKPKEEPIFDKEEPREQTKKKSPLFDEDLPF